MAADLSSPPAAAAGTAVGRPPGLGHRISGLLGWDAAIIGVLLAVLLVSSATVDGFANGTNAVFIVLDLIPLALIALPMTLIIVTGEIDLSVASTVGLTCAVMGKLWNQGMAIETIIPLCLVLGLALGALNGFFITVLGLPSLAVTIGTLGLFRGLAFVVLGDTAVADFPVQYTNWATGTLSGTSIPNVLIPLLIIAAGFGVLLHATPFGRAHFAAGANQEATRFTGIRVLAMKFWLYVASGGISALAGVYWTLRYASARADNAQGLELTVVTAVLLGGVSIFGGKGTLWGVLAGAVLLVSLQNALRLVNFSGESLNLVVGGLLIASVLAPNLVNAVGSALGRRQRRTTRPVV
jgi:rhamnose transport system permease protein